MTSSQKIIFSAWIKVIALFLVSVIIFISPIEEKQLIFLAVGGPLFLWLAFDKHISKCSGYGIHNEAIGEFINNNKYVKLWLVIYCFFILPVIIYNLYTSSETSFVLYSVSLFLLLGPVIMVSERERFIHAGKIA